MTRRPLGDDMRSRKPCVRRRLILLGWYWRLMASIGAPLTSGSSIATSSSATKLGRASSSANSCAVESEATPVVVVVAAVVVVVVAAAAAAAAVFVFVAACSNDAIAPFVVDEVCAAALAVIAAHDGVVATAVVARDEPASVVLVARPRNGASERRSIFCF